MGRFFYIACPLCQLGVDVVKPASYRILPLHYAHASTWLQEVPQCIGHNVLLKDGPYARIFSGGANSDRAVALHTRCLSFVQQLSANKLRRLLDLVDPTFLALFTGPVRECGAFQADGEVSQGPHLDLSRLPVEIRDLISEHGDVGRLEFIIRLGVQVSHPSISPLIGIPKPRFDVSVVEISGTVVRIHLIDIGGRSYVSHVSDPCWNDVQLEHRDHDFGDSTYLAVKSDGIGVVDLALSEADYRPKWIFNNSTRPFDTEISCAKDASLHKLRLVRDTMKCRAILPVGRGGVEPYFDSDVMPPGNSWIDSSVRVGSWSSEHDVPSAYFAKARYISFNDAQSLTVYTSLLRLGITEIYVNDPHVHRGYCVSFPGRPPRRLRISICRLTAGQQHPFMQFDVDGEWIPALPQSGIIIQHMEINDVIGVWLGETFPYPAMHLGMVRDGSAPRLRPGEQRLRVPDLSTFTSRW